jgi:hypothetical protein
MTKKKPTTKLTKPSPSHASRARARSFLASPVHDAIDAICDLIATGSPQASAAAMHGVSAEALRGRANEDPEIAMKLNRALAMGEARARRTLDDLTRTRGLLRSQLANDADAGPPDSALASAPAILRAPLMSRYLDGLVFTGALHGGHDRPDRSGFRAIDDAFRDPPTTTEQILHPARYAMGHRPAAIALPALSSMIDAGFVALDDETLGELEMSVFFAQGTSRDRDRDAAAGWDGDRIRVLHRTSDHALAFVWLTRWDDEREAIDAETAARRVSSSIATPTGPMTITRVGRSLAITAGLDTTAQAEIATSLTSL